MKVLIAEDDAVSRTILRQSVDKLGHECLAAEDVRAALELYRSAPGIGLVISDWMMPGIDGPALCRLTISAGLAAGAAATVTATPWRPATLRQGSSLVSDAL